MRGLPENNPNDLRVIKTARTKDTINAAAKEGFRPLIKAVEPGKEISHMVGVFQSKSTGKIELSGDCRRRPREDYELVLPYKRYYPYKFPNPFAAYLVPPDLEEGERVWLEDIIEDIVAVYGNQGYCPRLEACEAIWKDGDFEVQWDPYKDAEVWIG